MLAIRKILVQNPAISFFVMAFAFAWIFWIPTAILQIPIMPGAVLLLTGGFAPIRM